MGELRAYALAASELRGVVGATGAPADHLRRLTQESFVEQTRPLTVRDALGPIHRRVPGAPVVRPDDPTPGDLDALLAGTPVPPARAPATWRVLEAVVRSLALAHVRAPDVDLPVGLLAPTGLPVPAGAGLTVGWCPLERATFVAALSGWLGAADDWTREARAGGRPTPDAVVFWTRTR
ncbi:MAG TPA: hypothetical protein VGC37_09860 [Friedmanniella sp.]